MPYRPMMQTAIATNAMMSRSRIRRPVVEAEADAADGRDPHIGARFLELLAQARDRHVERLGRTEPVLVPHLVHDALTRHHTAALAIQVCEEIELLRRERDLTVAGECPACIRVDAQTGDGCRGLRR